MALSIKANAKINLGLRIIGRRDDGYHLLHTLFQELDFGDTLTLSEGSSGSVTLKVTGPAARGVSTRDDNLCVRAGRLLQERVGTRRGVHVVLEKRIPPGSGLGGGSSDAAAVLQGLNGYWQAGLGEDELTALAGTLGADVPFFIRGGLQLGEEVGTQLTPVGKQLEVAVVLVIPSFGVETAWAYGQLTARDSWPSAPAFDRLLAQTPLPWDRFTNDFEELVFHRHKGLAELKRGLLEAGALHASLAGSGSAVYGLFSDAQDPVALGHQFADSQVVVSEPVHRQSAA